MLMILIALLLAAFSAYSGPLEGCFTRNMGQWSDEVLFASSLNGSQILLTSHGITVADENGRITEYLVAGSGADPALTTGAPAPCTTSYFYGNDPEAWVTDVPSYTEVSYAGADPGSRVVLSLGESGLECRLAGDLTLQRSFDGQPMSAITSDQVLIPAAMPVEYDSQVEALFSTYFGAGGDDRSYSIAFGPDGKIFLTGRTSSLDYPLLNPYQGTHGGSMWDAFVTCISADGSQLVYSTYIGGSSDDNGYGIKVDAEGCAYVTGPTESADFPVVNAFQQDLEGTRDVFVLKLSASGSSLDYSTYLGGSVTETGRDIAVDSTGGVYVTGTTLSIDFPTMNPWQSSAGGGGDAFFAKLSPTGGALLASTYIGGSGEEVGEGITIDPTGRAIVTGSTESSDFPTASPFQGTYGGGTDAYIVRFDPSGDSVQFSTYLGGSGYETGQNVAANENHIAVTGNTASTDFPTVDPIQASLPGVSAVFVSRYGLSGSSQLFSTYIGGSQADFGRDLAIADDGSIYVTGLTASADFPVVDPWQEFYAGGSNDCILLKITPSDSLEYSTFVGGSGNDGGRGLALNTDGTVVITGGMFSQDFPMLDPLQGTYGGGETDIFITAFNDALLSAEGEEVEPGSSILIGVSPNPAGSQAAVNLSLPIRTSLEMGIYDLSGRMIDSIRSEEEAEQGIHTIDLQTGSIPAGIYILRVTAPGLVPASAMMVIL